MRTNVCKGKEKKIFPKDLVRIVGFSLSVVLSLITGREVFASDRGVYLKFNLWRDGYIPSLYYVENQPWGKLTFNYKLFGGFKIKTKILNSINFSYKSSQGLKFSLKPKLIKDIEAGYRRYRKSLLSSLSLQWNHNRNRKPYLVFCEKFHTDKDCPLKRFLFKRKNFLFINPPRPLRGFTVYIKGKVCPYSDLVLVRADDPMGKPFIEIFYGGNNSSVKIKVGSYPLSVIVPADFPPNGRLSFVFFYDGKTIGCFINRTSFSFLVPRKVRNTNVGDIFLVEVKKGCFEIETLAVYPKRLSQQELFILNDLNF